ncbi:arginine utilization regulatory protein [Dethiosulfatibacter aminovorans DSM 17477]|uniref:Arginine utilization regulatory protein n=1 Tax=Dethiosulfatibacter aminovorans DSM 17477 TaxID=1121476 RepID=A0A1M6F3N4_9FIRM|nr:sigma 54-interacting transcriptional regulator [Dethiosulfatibacter aminovorans]SHI92291.1 arginine utilization regulatory protein [Dethiosulfatibacter aminovorans DSM 17477]
MEELDRKLLLDIVLNNLDKGMAIINRNGEFIYYNRKIAELEGFEPEEVLGHHLQEMFPTDESSMLNVLENGIPIYNSLQEYINKNGKKIFSMVTDVPIISEGEIEGVVEFVHDIDQIKQIYQAIQSFEKSIDSVKRTKNDGMKKLHEFKDYKTLNFELLELLKKIEKLSLSRSNVLIYGETGTGKEIIAQSIHTSSERKNKPFVAQNCAAIPETLLESILFGTVKGSFTGSIERKGLFEKADGGTLLLDELNSMPMHLQSKLLRVIQEGYIRRVGGSSEIKVDVRVVATVNADPNVLIENCKLREDLFYRLSIISIYVPPLRSRSEDIEYLSKLFIDAENKFKNMNLKLSHEVLELFNTYDWKGNVRELKNIIESACNVAGDDKYIKLEHLPCYLIERLRSRNLLSDDNQVKSSYSDMVESFEKGIISEMLKKTEGNVSKASKLLKIKRQTLQHKIKKLNIR